MTTNELIFYIVIFAFNFGVFYLMGKSGTRTYRTHRFKREAPQPNFFTKTTYYYPKEKEKVKGQKEN